MSDKLVLYHAGCPDGFCAAWVAWRKLGALATYLPVKYGDPPPDVRGKSVFVVDFSYDYETTKRMAQEAVSLVVLDHHKTAETGLRAAQQSGHAQVVFDMERSGAGLARDFFHTGWSSWVVDYTQDRDLWRWLLPCSKQVNSYLSIVPRTFEAYDDLHNNVSVEDATKLGAAVALHLDTYIALTSRDARLTSFAGYDNVLVVNATGFGASELLVSLAQRALFSVGWHQAGDGRLKFSLRSVGDFDVSAVAQRFGGGGHKNAAGFTTDPGALLQW